MLKGRTFTPADLPKNSKLSGEQAEEWAKRMTERQTIVALDTNDEPIIAEELQQRILNTLSPPARRLAGKMMMIDAAARREILAAFDVDGELKFPFRKPARVNNGGR